MKRVGAVLLAGLWLLAAASAVALELGDIEVGSLRGEPLLARIALPDLPEGAEQDLTVRLGSEEEFSRAGLERPSHLGLLEFRIVAEGEEPAHVMIRGRDPIDTPLVSLLIEGVWSGGRVFREYTLVLDFAPPLPAGSYGPVRAVDTLWSLAGRYRSKGISVQRMMLAMLAQNPHAFTIENVNALRAGAVLKIPALDRIGTDEKSSAMQEVRRQNDDWQVYLRSPAAEAAAADSVVGDSAVDDGEARTADAQPVSEMEADPAIEESHEPELRVIAPGVGEARGSEDDRALRVELDLALEEVDSRRQQISDMSARLDEAERLIADLQRLVELKDDDIAGFQRRLALEAEAAAQAQAEAQAEAQAQTEAANVARWQVEAEAAARAQDEARAQAEVAAQAQAEARTQAEAAAQARAELAEAQTGVARTQAPEQENTEAALAGADAAVEVEAVDEGIEVEVEAEDAEDAASPGLLAALEDLLGFSPVVGGVGLVGVILILGGLIALMRRRSSGREYTEEDDLADVEDESSDPWEDESFLADDLSGPAEGEASAATDARAPKSAQRPVDGEPDVDDFDIGIDLDEVLTRSLEDELASDADFESGSTALERALGSAGEPDIGRSPPNSRLDSAPAARSDFDSDIGEGSARELDDRTLAELIDSTPEFDVGSREPSPEAWQEGAPGRVRSALDAPMADFAQRIGSGDEARKDARSTLGVDEGLAGSIDELQIKLDLAQTYVDMENFDDARALLREVQAEGDLEQRAIARYLSGKLP